MKNYAAKIDDGIVSQVIVGDYQWASQRLGGDWVSSSDKIGIGYIFDGENFYPPKPFDSWVFDGSQWSAPVEYPDDGQEYYWNEDAASWSLIEE